MYMMNTRALAFHPEQTVCKIVDRFSKAKILQIYSELILFFHEADKEKKSNVVSSNAVSWRFKKCILLKKNSIQTYARISPALGFDPGRSVCKCFSRFSEAEK